MEKVYNQTGVSKELEFDEDGAWIKSEVDHFKFLREDKASLRRIKISEGVDDDDAVAISQLDVLTDLPHTQIAYGDVSGKITSNPQFIYSDTSFQAGHPVNGRFFSATSNNLNLFSTDWVGRLYLSAAPDDFTLNDVISEIQYFYASSAGIRFHDLYTFPLTNSVGEQYLKNDGTGTLSWGTVTPPQALTDTRIAFGSATNLVTESADLTFNSSTKVLNVGGNVRSTKAVGDNGFEIYGGSAATNPTSLTINAQGLLALLKVNGVNHLTIGGGGLTTYGYLFPDVPNTRAIGAPTYAFAGIHGTAFRSPNGADRLWEIIGTSTTNGNSLTIKAGDAFLSGTHLKGGNLKLSSGIGTLGSNIEFLTSSPSVNSTTYNVPTVKATLFGNGNFSLGNNGVAKLNITADGNAGGTKGLSIFDSGTVERFSFYDNGYLQLRTSEGAGLDYTHQGGLYLYGTTQNPDFAMWFNGIPYITMSPQYGNPRMSFNGSLSFYNTAGTSRPLLLEENRVIIEPSTYIGGIGGDAKLNVTASGTGGTSKAISILDNGGTQKAYILDNGNTEIKGTLSVQESGLIKVNSIGIGSSNIEVQRSGVAGITLYSSDGTNPAEVNRLYFNKYIEVRDINASDYMVAYNQTGNWTLNKAANNHFGQLGLWGTARMNVYAANNNGTSAIFSGFNSDGINKFQINDQGSTWLGGTNGVARLNIKAELNDGSSRIINGFNNLGADVFSVDDLGTIRSNAIKTIVSAGGAIVIGYASSNGASDVNLAVVIGTQAGSSALLPFNTIVGTYALNGGGAAYQTVALGYAAGYYSSAQGATIVGTQAGYQAGSSATAIGMGSGGKGGASVAVGYNSGYDNSGGGSVTIGAYAGNATSANVINAIGYRAMTNNTASYNTVYGHEVAAGSTTLERATVMGYYAANGIIAGSSIIAVGVLAAGLANNVEDTVAIGDYALYSSATNCKRNTVIGMRAASNSTDLTDSVMLGYYAGANANGSHKLYIANSATNTPLIYGEFDNNLLRVSNNLTVKSNNINISNIPTSATGLSTGDVWNNGGVLSIV